MSFNDVIQFVGSIGFPIIMCLMLYDRMGKQDDQHREEMKQLNESLNNNTQALIRLTDKLDHTYNQEDSNGSN